MLNWLQNKANLGTFAIGFCELNGWEEIQSNTDILKNYPKITMRSSNAGFAHSHIMTKSTPYNIGNSY